MTEAFGLTQAARIRPTSTASVERDGERRERRPREPATISAIIQKPLKPFKWPKGPDKYVTPKRLKDLTAAYINKGMKMKRWAREGELVWAVLEYPIFIVGDSTPDNSILFWPALVKEIRLRTNINPKPSLIPQNGSEMDVDAVRGLGDPSGSHCGAKDPWTVEQSHIYLLKFLGVTQQQVVQGTQILPYQAYAPSDTLLATLKSLPVDLVQIAREHNDVQDLVDATETLEQRAMTQITQFRPFEVAEDDPTQSYESMQKKAEHAARAYCVAIQIGSRLANYWSPTDEFDYRINPEDSWSNTVLNGSVPRTMVSENGRLQRHSTGLLNGFDSPVQIRFQGLWWGAERIWVGELVRLKIGRHQLSTRAYFIKQPSRPSKGTEHFIKQTDLLSLTREEEGSNAMASDDGIDSLDIMGAASRAVFMRIDGIVANGSPSDRTTFRELRLCGTLYELADEDEESENEHVPTARPDIKGKGTEVPRGSKSESTQSASNGPALPPALAERLANPPKPHPDGKVLTYDEAVALSTPRRQTFPLPQAPSGYRFRPILYDGYEAVMDAVLLSGRYYPRILDNPLMLPYVNAAKERPEVGQNKALWALEGLEPGVHNVVDPTKWMKSRAEMMNDATRIAERELVEFWTSRRSESGTTPPTEQGSASSSVVDQYRAISTMEVDL